MSKFTPSIYQQEFLDWLRSGAGSCVLVAVAGSGKTTTIMAGLDVIPEDKFVNVLMFNNTNSKDANEKFAKMKAETGKAYRRTRISTFHSMGWGACRKWFEARGITPRDPDKHKVRNIIQETFTPEGIGMYGDFCSKLVDFGKGVGIGPLVRDTDENWYEIIKHHDIYLDDENATEDAAIAYARSVLAESNRRADMGHCDFNDMLLMPLRHRMRLWQNDHLIIDEAQDTNAVRRALAKAALKPYGRLTAVGDPKQGIYGFTGASHDAIDLIREEFNARQMTLPVCYRCSRAVIRKAQTIVDYIQPHENAVEGSDTYLHPEDAILFLSDRDAVLCRNTAPLISFAFQCIAKGRGVTVLGRDIGQNLIKLIEKQKTRGIDTLTKKLELWAERETTKFLARGEEGKAESVNDRIACINAVIENLHEKERTVPGLIAKLQDLFSDDNGRLMLSTVHKSKGREWDNVAILRPDLMPSGWARQTWQQDQESNLMYVCWTRAKINLITMDEKAPRMKK